MSINQMKFSLNISWTINCNIDIQDINQKNQNVQLAQKIETATINGKKNHQRYIGKLNKSKFSESEGNTNSKIYTNIILILINYLFSSYQML